MAVATQHPELAPWDWDMNQFETSRCTEVAAQRAVLAVELLSIDNPEQSREAWLREADFDRRLDCHQDRGDDVVGDVDA